MASLNNISRLLSQVLRHNPEKINITLDKEGWASVEELLTNIKPSITFDQLQEIVDTNDKKRFAFNEDKTKIRASQGHNAGLGVEINYPTAEPKTPLYHGTSEENLEIILKEGLKAWILNDEKVKGRTHVHLSKDVETATTVGKRKKGKTILLEIDAMSMIADGLKIYISENNVYLADEVPPKYITTL